MAEHDNQNRIIILTNNPNNRSEKDWEISSREPNVTQLAKPSTQSGGNEGGKNK